MPEKSTEGTSRIAVHGAADEANLTPVLENGYQDAQVPLKVITGVQHTSGLSFELKPGAIVAHTGSTVIFVCG
ncbi:hypothetical protein [Ralstonia sp. Ralssp135]|jgi:hypothetical protein|uniref:hypothetical protein n=1 Tax=Ralstonia sp. Ralssp135 TaxID=3243016 RepID=UPI0039AFFA0D